MTDDLALYETDRPAWLATVAPKQAARIADDTYDDASLAYAWASMQRDYQTAVWALLPEAQKQRIRMLRRGK
jgi:hypothetical protein